MARAKKDWKDDILQQLKERDRKQKQPFEDLINSRMCHSKHVFAAIFHEGQLKISSDRVTVPRSNFLDQAIQGTGRSGI